MSIQKVIQESIAGNPLEMKEALAEELKNRVAEAIAAKMEEVELDEALDHEGLKKDFGDSDAKVHSVATAHRAPAEVIGHKSFKTDKGKVPVLKHYDRENFEHKEVPLRKGQKLVHDGDEHYHGYSDTHGHFRVHEDDMNKSHLRESMEELDEERKSSSYQFTHKPGDAASEKKLADLKQSVKGTGKRVVLQGRLGKDNPNAHKYSKDAPSAKYVDGKRVNSDVSGKSGGHSHQRIQKADAAHHDVYVYNRNESVELNHEDLNSIAKDHDIAAKKHRTAYAETRSTAAARNHEVAYNRHVDAAKAHREAANDKSKHSSEKLEKMSNHAWDATDHIRKHFDEEVEQIDEISKSTLGSYATKALRRGDIANRMSKSDDDEMGKIANKRLSGVKKAVDKLADKTGKKALATSIKKDVDATKAAGDAYTRKTGVDDQGKSYYKAARNIGKMREEVELDESEGRQIVDKLKSTGNHEEAGKMAFKHGLGRNYGPHFGLRSNKYSAETAYHKGYDKAELANRKKI